MAGNILQKVRRSADISVAWLSGLAVQSWSTEPVQCVQSCQQFVERTESSISLQAMTACAMGNFQCDVAYCRKNFCNAQYQARYREWLWSIHVESTRVSGS